MSSENCHWLFQEYHNFITSSFKGISQTKKKGEKLEDVLKIRHKTKNAIIAIFFNGQPKFLQNI
jgi:hypothetical protein